MKVRETVAASAEPLASEKVAPSAVVKATAMAEEKASMTAVVAVEPSAAIWAAAKNKAKA